MRIVTGSTMASLDRIAIEERGIPSLDLMERAGQGVAVAILRRYPWVSSPLIVCGPGNNGGDGFVVARYLQKAGRNPAVVVLAGANDLSPDARANLERMREECALEARVFLPGKDAAEGFPAAVSCSPDLVVDGIFGTGFRGRIKPPYVPVLEYLNAVEAPRVAIDIASGVSAENGQVEGIAFQADLTVTMALPKVGHLLPPGIDHTGHVEVVDIGIPKDVLEQGTPDEARMVSADEVRGLLPRYAYSAHKGDRGHLLILAGSPGLTGAGCLAGEAALYSGAGLVTVGVPKPLNPVFETKLTEVMTLPLPGTAGSALASSGLEAVVDFASRADAVVFGPGVGRDEDTAKLLLGLLERLEKPLLVDADGLNLLVGHADLLKARRSPTILTPHPGEMGRLIGSSAREVQSDRWGIARRYAETWGGILVLKGAGTVIAGQGSLWVNPTGGPAMSQGGMGDALSGVIGSLLAQGVGPLDAACLGTFLHGLSGDIRAQGTLGEVVTASEVGRGLRRAMTEVRRSRSRAIESLGVGS